MSADIFFRPMHNNDLGRVMAVEKAAYEIPWSQKVFERCLTGKDECWVLCESGVVYGHGVVSNILDEAHLLNLCIDPRKKRQGLGRVFLEFLIRNAIAKRSSVFFLEVRVSNLPAISLYRAQGFNEVGIRPNYYPGKKRREDAMLMTLELSLDHFV